VEIDKVKQKKRANNEGTVYQRPDGIWVAQITTGYHPITGKTKRRTFYGKTKAEVIKKKNNALVELERGIYNEPTKISLGDWIREWLNDRKPHLAESTYDLYEMLIRVHIDPTFGGVKLQSL
jgi:integrase